MAMQTMMRCKGYHYVEKIEQIDAEAINTSKEAFSYFKENGVIISGEYESQKWVLSDEVRARVTINVAIDEEAFEQDAAQKLGCTSEQYLQAMRVAVTSRFGYSLRTLQGDAHSLVAFTKTLESPQDYSAAQLLLDLLELLPGTTIWRRQMIKTLQLIPAPRRSATRQRRKLAVYQSYFRFNDLLDCFWKEASREEKSTFFPIYFWWKVTSILPLRPNECVLTPRHCVRKDHIGNWLLTIRRTKRKGTIQATEYSIEKDYEKHEYRIPKELAQEIVEYVDLTNSVYESDIDVLFCKSTQFSSLGVLQTSDKHYTRQNLGQCLWHFYEKILQKRYGYTIPEDNILLNKEITRISLGDTRHIAMISLMISGGSPSICRELAGHNDIEIGANYYGNLENFLDLLSYERFRPEEDPPQIFIVPLPSISRSLPVAGGYCQSTLAQQGDFTHCGAAVNADGELGVCKVCKYFLSKAGSDQLKQDASDDLKQTVMLLRQTIRQMQEGNNVTETLSYVLDRLRAEASRYCHASAVARLLNKEVIE